LGDEIKNSEMDLTCSTHGGQEKHPGFCWGNLREGDHLEVPDIDGRITLKWVFKKWEVGAVTGLIWFRIGTCGRLL
jgi:hypothetical protein